MEYNIKWNGRTIDNTGRHHLRWSARRTRARRYLSCPGGCLVGISFRGNCLFVVCCRWNFFVSLGTFSFWTYIVYSCSLTTTVFSMYRTIISLNGDTKYNRRIKNVRWFARKVDSLFFFDTFLRYMQISISILFIEQLPIFTLWWMT